VTIIGGGGQVSTGEIIVSRVSPGIFTANPEGTGVAAANIVRVKPDGSQITEPVARFDLASGRWVPIPIDLGPETDTIALVLYGTGIRFRDNINNVRVRVGNATLTPFYAGPQNTYVGLDQINVVLGRNPAFTGEVPVEVIVEGKTANLSTLTFK
jgi:uncharacterized protein (TIGR03437 family)